MAELQTNVKQGAIIGGWICFAVGLAFMALLPLLGFIFYGPLFFAAFVLSIVAMAQRRVAGGLTLLLCCIVLPPIFFFARVSQRAEQHSQSEPQTQKTEVQPQSQPNPSVKESGTPQDSSEGISDWGKRVLAQSEQQEGEDAEFKRAASEIASARIHQALHQYWNDQDGFSLSPMDLQYVVSKFDTERIKKLDEEYSTIWKSVDPIFADHYCQLQAPVNDKHLKDLQAVRRLITEGINEAVDARGGGSASHMLLVFGAAETEWILRQLYRSSPPSMAKTQFISELRSNIFYEGAPEVSPPFERAIDRFRQAEATMSDAQQAVFRREILAYFGWSYEKVPTTTAAPSAPSPFPHATRSDANDQRLTKFTNQKYGCAILVPLNVFPDPPQQPDDEHTKFVSTDGRTTLELVVDQNPQKRAVAEVYRKWIAQGEKKGAIGYKTLKGNWFVVSGDMAGRGYYTKCVGRDNKLFFMNVDYDEEADTIRENTMTTMSRSFNGRP